MTDTIIKYRLNKMNSSSAKYGDCEVCNKPVSDVYLQTPEHKTSRGWNYGISTFGHKDCLLNIRR